MSLILPLFLLFAGWNLGDTWPRRHTRRGAVALTATVVLAVLAVLATASAVATAP